MPSQKAYLKLKKEAALELQRGGVDGISLCVNTPHKVYDQIQASLSIPILHIADAMGKHLRSAGLDKVGLVGTRFTMAPSAIDQDVIQEMLYNKLSVGIFDDQTKMFFVDVIESLAEKGAKAVILGCTVSSTRDTILELSESLSIISQSINELANECQQIKEITGSISGISEQTNLLALNAAIEAARVGEHGKGFAVVADEVRVFPSRTQQSTVEISTMIDRLQRGSTQAVEAVDARLEKVSFSVEQIQQTENAFADIADSVADVNHMNMQIATVAEQQSSVAEEMNKNVTSISSHSYKTMDNVKELEEEIEILMKNV
ncbi:methyl-accepting chemotaxis protein [Vibrio sp. MA40-2]|uniref:methyl-accepting chemotaxis protein n=1 Tax=Vibrio sp. MA40-2 TaxID=3391828 RepID=UPI0039A596D3